MTTIYYECHITIEPVDEVLTLPLLKLTVERYGFRVADLLLQNGSKSRVDTFISGRGDSYESLYARMRSVVTEIQSVGLKVWRYKIENVVLDSRVEQLAELPL